MDESSREETVIANASCAYPSDSQQTPQALGRTDCFHLCIYN